ncbi:MAG: YceI family protein, partial [Gemmataceae bacterium]
AAAEVKFPLTADNTQVTFTGTKPDGKHTGGFKAVTGTASVDPADPTTLKLSVEFDIKSMHSDSPKLTQHLLSDDFFSASKHPKASFESTKVAKDGDGVTVTGKLTLCGKTKEISFPAKVTATADGLKLTSALKIDRTEFGMTYGKGKIDDAVALDVAVNATK